MEQSSPNVQAVSSFLEALESYDIDALVACCAPDVLYYNNRIRTAKGLPRFEKVMKGLAGATTGFEIEGLTIFEDADGIVHADRRDWISRGRFRMGIDVEGRFELESGLIVRWTDYFSWRQTMGAIFRGRRA